MLPIWLAALALGGCVASCADGAEPGIAGGGAAPLRGFGVDVDQAIAPRVPVVHLRTCGSWGCREQDVTLLISGPTSAMPCPSEPAAADTACGVVQLPGPGPGYGYVPVPELTMDQVTVTVTTPAGESLSGTLVHMDDFHVSLRDESGAYRTVRRGPDVRIVKNDPYAAHVELLSRITDKAIHDVVAYLESLK